VARSGAERLELGKRQFDRIEVRRVGREIEDVTAPLLDQGPDIDGLMGAQIVEQDDLTGTEHGSQEIADVDPKRGGVDRPPPGHRRTEASGRESRDQGRGDAVVLGNLVVCRLGAGSAGETTG
jgi:hypothetical protein